MNKAIATGTAGGLAFGTSPVSGRPSWVPPGATVWGDFVNNRFFWNGAIRSLSDISVTRATTAWQFASDGVTIQSVPANTLRQSFNSLGGFDGVLINHQRTNSFTNSPTPLNQSVTLTTGQFCIWAIGLGSISISAGTGVATGLGSQTAAATRSDLYGLGLFRQFNVTTAGTFNIVVSGDLTHAQIERQDSVGSAPCHPGPPIVTGGSSVTVNSDQVRIQGLTGLSSDSAALLFTAIQRGRTNFSRLISPGRTTFETSGASNQTVLTNDNVTHYAAVMALFPSTPLNNVFRISAAFQTGTNNSRLVYNGAQFGTSSAYTGVVDTYDTLGLGVAPNFSSSTFCGTLQTFGVWPYAETTANLIAAGA